MTRLDCSIDDRPLSEVVDELYRLDPEGERAISAVRRARDAVYAPDLTGRRSWQELSRTERRGLHGLIEIHLQREFGLADGNRANIAIAGYDVEMSLAAEDSGWIVPRSAIGDLCLLVIVAEDCTVLGIGIVRATLDVFSRTTPQIGSLGMSRSGREEITWIWTFLRM